jgi:hypothetical protein
MRTLLLLVTCAVVATSLSDPAAAAVNDDDVQAAVDRAVKFFLARQKPNGLFSDNPDFDWRPGGVQTGGEDCWVLVGLAYAGVDVKRDEMKKAIEAVLKLEPQKVYAVSARIIALSHLYRRLDRELQERVRPVIAKDLAWLLKAQGAEGQWDYPSLDNRSSPHWDLSNTQMAVLALSEAIAVGFEPPEKAIQQTQNLYLEWQDPDGGWAYGSRSLGGNMGVRDSYGSMTAAGVASLYITRDYLFRDLGCPCSNGRSRLRPQKVDQAIQRGAAWLGKHFEADCNPHPMQERRGGIIQVYWLYSCERVGLAAGLKYFGAHNWYAEGAEVLLKAQDADGSWKIINGYHLPDTAWAICFLMKGRAPVLYNKLQFDGQWDNHTRDVANLVRYVAGLKEQPFQWQVIHLQAPVDEWHDAPVLYISAETKIPLTDADKAALRRFTDTGGTILFEASCGNTDVKTWWEKTSGEIWPDWEYKKLERDHPVYSSDQKVAKTLPYMKEMSDGLRTIVFFATSDLSCAWNGNAVGQRLETFGFGANLYVYASDRRPMRARLAVRKPVGDSYGEAKLAAGGKAVTVARVKHGGDFYVGRNYEPWKALAASLQAKGGAALTDAGEKSPAELKSPDVTLAYLTGRQGLTLSDEDVKALGEYLTGGGFLLVEAALGDTRFDAAAQPILAKMGLTLRMVPATHGLMTGQLGAATGYAVKAVRYKPTAASERLGRPAELIGLYRGEQLVGIYSPLDMVFSQTGCDAWGNRGYAEDDARALLSNIVLWASGR